jgi:hypothetical protein
VFVQDASGSIIGTAVRVTLTNLQGSGFVTNPPDPSYYPTGHEAVASNLSDVELRWAIAAGVPIPTLSTTLRPVLTGAAVGHPAWVANLAVQPAHPSTPFLMAVLSFSGLSIGGCSASVLATVYTCARSGPAGVAFDFLLPFRLDLDPAAGGGLNDFFASEHACYSGQTHAVWGANGFIGTSQQAVTTVDVCPPDGAVYVTPEPVTLILLGSGLAGLGGAALRRRRRQELPAA